MNVTRSYWANSFIRLGVQAENTNFGERKGCRLLFIESESIKIPIVVVWVVAFDYDITFDDLKATDQLINIADRLFVDRGNNKTFIHIGFFYGRTGKNLLNPNATEAKG